MTARLGRPRRHFRAIASTNDVASALAKSNAPAGTLVTAESQTAGRGRQGREWVAPAGRALLFSLILRAYDPLLPLRAGLAVSDVAGPDSRVKWPNDVLIGARKIAGVLVEARPQEGWAVVGIGINVALAVEDLPPGAGTLGRDATEIEPTLTELLECLSVRLIEPADASLAALRSRDALKGRTVCWSGGTGTAAGIDDRGALLLRTADGPIALNAGEVHLLDHGR